MIPGRAAQRALQALALLALAAAALRLAPACYGRGGGGTPCQDAGDCPSRAGSLEGCVDGHCAEVDCLSSLDCPMGSYCDVADGGFDCEEGCQSDADCLSGQRCDGGSCAPSGCRSSVLDCEFGEACDAATGQCSPADGTFCATCDPSGHDFDNQGTVTVCDDTIRGHDLCGVGAFCIGDPGDGGAFCAPPCAAASDCPAGFQCAPISRGLPSSCEQDQLLLGFACLADCATYAGD